MFDRTIVRGLSGLSVVYLWRHGRLCRFVLVAAFVFSACGLAQAGWGTWTQIDGDASSSVVAGTYTTAVNLGGSSITVNGVPFAAGGSSGTGYFFDSNWQSASPDSLSGVSGSIATLLDASVRPSHSFGFYNSNFTFNGLTAGDAYLATFFFPGTTAGGATGDVTYQFGAGSDLTYVTSPADASKGYYLSYSYTAQSSTLSFAFPALGSENIRLAGFSNRLDVPPPPATSYPTWNAVGSGDWNNSSNWDNGNPTNGVGATAIMGSANTGPTLVYTTSGETLGNLIFDSSNSYTLAGAYPNGTLTLSSTGTALMNVQQGTHVLDLPTTFAGSTTISVSAGSTFRISNPINLDGQVVTKSGPGTLVLDVNFQSSGGTLAASAGMLDVGPQAVITPAALSVGGSANARRRCHRGFQRDL